MGRHRIGRMEIGLRNRQHRWSLLDSQEFHIVDCNDNKPTRMAVPGGASAAVTKQGQNKRSSS